MNHAAAPAATETQFPPMRVSAHAASFLTTQHGAGAMAEAIRHGMDARRRDDDAGADFWCAVCSALVRMQQLAA